MSTESGVSDQVTHFFLLTSLWLLYTWNLISFRYTANLISCDINSLFSPADFSSLLPSSLISTLKPKNRPPSPAAPRSRPLSPLVPAPASKTPTSKKTATPGTKTRPKRAQTPVRVQPQTVTAVTTETGHEAQQSDTPEEKKSECGYHGDDSQVQGYIQFSPNIHAAFSIQYEQTLSSV